jgi:hypothetical protein
VLTDEEEVEERSHPYEVSCRIVNHVNEDDDKLENFITAKKDLEECYDHWRIQDIPTKHPRRG